MESKPSRISHLEPQGSAWQSTMGTPTVQLQIILQKRFLHGIDGYRLPSSRKRSTECWKTRLQFLQTWCLMSGHDYTTHDLCRHVNCPHVRVLAWFISPISIFQTTNYGQNLRFESELQLDGRKSMPLTRLAWGWTPCDNGPPSVAVFTLPTCCWPRTWTRTRTWTGAWPRPSGSRLRALPLQEFPLEILVPID